MKIKSTLWISCGTTGVVSIRVCVCWVFYSFFFSFFLFLFFLSPFLLFCYVFVCFFNPSFSDWFDCPITRIALLRLCSSVATLERKKNTVRWFNLEVSKKKTCFLSPCTPTLKRKQSGYRKAFSFIASLHLLFSSGFSFSSEWVMLQHKTTHLFKTNQQLKKKKKGK